MSQKFQPHPKSPGLLFLFGRTTFDRFEVISFDLSIGSPALKKIAF